MRPSSLRVPWPAWVLLQGRGRAVFSSEASQAGTDLPTGLLLFPGERGAGRTPSTRPLPTTCSAGMALPCTATRGLPAVTSLSRFSSPLRSCSCCGPLLPLHQASFLASWPTAPGCPPPSGYHSLMLCLSLRCEVLGPAGSSALPARLTPPVSSPLASCLLSPDSTNIHLSSRHLHVDVRGPSAQPPSFPSNLFLLSQLLTPSCCSKTTCMLVRSRL